MDGLTMEREISNIPVGMRPGLRKLNEAVIRVALSEAVPEAMRAGIREVSEFYVPPIDRRKKIGTMLLNVVCQEADANNMTLMLIARPPEPDDFVTLEDGTRLAVDAEGDRWPAGPDEAQLVAWYQRFGFTVLQETAAGTLMARRVHVRARPRIVALGDSVLDHAVRQAMRAGRAN
jgi:GNAT superfamily N-acetyltransferase